MQAQKAARATYVSKSCVQNVGEINPWCSLFYLFEVYLNISFEVIHLVLLLPEGSRRLLRHCTSNLLAQNRAFQLIVMFDQWFHLRTCDLRGSFFSDSNQSSYLSNKLRSESIKSVIIPDPPPQFKPIKLLLLLKHQKKQSAFLTFMNLVF